MSSIHVLPHHSHARQTLLCLHGSASSGRQWARLAVSLAPHLKVLTPELLGYSSSTPWAADASASLDDEAKYLAPFLARDDGVHLLGHSFGGAVALQLALRWPTRVKSLTLYEPVRFGLLLGNAGWDMSGCSIKQTARRVGTAVRLGHLAEAAEVFVDFWSESGAWGLLGPRQQQAVAHHMPKVNAEFKALFAERVPATAYRELTMPVHLMAGTTSPLPTRRVVDVLAHLLPQAAVVRIPGLGHMAPVTDADVVGQHLPTWLRSDSQLLAAA